MVGLALGVGLALAFVLFPPPLQGVGTTALWLGLTGALHFDGFCDLADAAFAPKGAEERWRIVKDPHIGSFALAAGSLLLLTKVAAVGSLESLLPLLLIPLLSRTAVVVTMAGFRVHDTSLLGRTTSLTWSETLLPLSLGFALSAVLATLGVGAHLYLALVTTALLTALGGGAWLNHRMEGLGGDAYGAVVESSEALMLVVAVGLTQL